MSRLLDSTVLALLLVAPSLCQLNYYPPPLTNHHHNPINRDDGRQYELYFKPVLLDRSSPVDMMYMALNGKDIFLYPSAFHRMPPYPLQHLHPPGRERVPLTHHIDNTREYIRGDDENYSNEDDKPEPREDANSTTTISNRTLIRVANLTQDAVETNYSNQSD